MDVFTALADPTRLKIIEMIALRGRLSSGDIGDHFDISAPAISQHLKVLREAGLVIVETKGQQRIYSLNLGGVDQITGWIERMHKMWVLSHAPSPKAKIKKARAS